MDITDIWEEQDGDYFCVSTKSASGKWRDEFFEYGDWDAVRKFISDSWDKDVYFCPHGFTKPSRKKHYAVDPHLLYSDLDEMDPETTPHRPTIAFRSSPGRYVGFWVTDKPASEELNRRMTYYIGGDASGWDRTQVLRVPGTANYKYPTEPTVKLLWDNGPEYKISTLEAKIPELATSAGEEVDVEAADVFKQYEKKLPQWARKELISGKPRAGERSEMIWKLQNTCLEVGMTREEAFSIVWASPWNKFRDRRDGVDQLWRELDKAMDKHFTRGGYTKKDTDTYGRFFTVPMSEVKRENVDWIIPGFLARKNVTILEGDPGTGKSTFAYMLAKQIVDGIKFPFSSLKYKPEEGKVAYFDMENDKQSIVKGLLDDNRVKNQAKIFVVDRNFAINDEDDKFIQAVDEIEDYRPTVFVFDTMNYFLGDSDSYNAGDVSALIGRLKDICVRLNCACLMVRHNKKSHAGKAINAGQGSVAFGGSARCVFTIAKHPEDPDNERIVAPVKTNLGSPFRPFSYSMERLPDKGEFIDRKRVVWGEYVDYSSDELVNLKVGEKDTGKETNKAVEYLEEKLADGPVMKRQVLRDAEVLSLSERTIQRAFTKLGGISETKGFSDRKAAYWSLPDEPKSAHD
jgi:archaellum biogenesis ATPase FlaH